MIDDLTKKQYGFMLDIYKGISQRQAYINNYDCQNMSIASIDVAASRLANDPKVKLSLKTMRQTTQAHEVISKQEILEKYADMFRASLVDFQDQDGQPQLTPEIPHNAAAREYYHRRKVNQFGDETITKSIKLQNPVEIGQEIAKLQGYYAPTRSIHESISFEVNLVEKPINKESDKDFIEPD